MSDLETRRSLKRSNEALIEVMTTDQVKMSECLMTLRYDGDTKDRTIDTLEQRLRDHGL